MIINHKYKFIFIKNVKTAGTTIEFILSKICYENDIVTPSEENLKLLYNYQLATNYLDPTKPYKNKMNFKNIFLNFKSLLKDILFKKKVIYKPLLEENILYYNHFPAKDLKKKIEEKIFTEYFKFCVVRDPYNQILSMYYNDVNYHNEKLNFEDWLKRKGKDGIMRVESFFKSSIGIITENKNLILDKYIKYENLTDELEKFFNEKLIKLNAIDELNNFHIKKNKKKIIIKKNELTPRSVALINEYGKFFFDTFGYEKQ